MSTFNDDPVEHRKDVWRAVRERGIVLTLAPVKQEKISGLKPGLVVFADERPVYCDGRVPAQTIDQIDGREVLYIPFVEKKTE